MHCEPGVSLGTQKILIRFFYLLAQLMKPSRPLILNARLITENSKKTTFNSGYSLLSGYRKRFKDQFGKSVINQ